MAALRFRSIGLAFLIPSIGLLGCAGTVIDSQKAEDAIADDVETKTGARVKAVSCPDDVEVEAGTRFECQVTAADGSRAVAELKILNDDADVRVLRLRKQ